MKKSSLILLLALGSWLLTPLKAQNNPYIDDKLIHFGFSLGLNFMSFGVTDSEEEVLMNGKNEILHARVSNMMPGFSVGFVSDLRMSRHLNLRFCPGLSFSQRTLTYVAESGNPVHSIGDQHRDKIDVLSIPITIPLYIKWSAEREKNFRPYLIGGGGVEFNVYRDSERPVMLKSFDYFVEVGVGCDFYFEWFKWCPQITYRIGFADILTHVDENIYLTPDETFYTAALRKLTSRMLCITFNFE